MKKILIIGAGANQVPIIKTAKEHGCYVIVVTPRGEYPGIDIADEWIEEDIFHKEKIVELVKNKDLDGVISDQSDMAAPIVAYIAEALDLPTFGYNNALYFTDKKKMRDLFETLGFKVPKYEAVTSIEDAFVCANQIGYPIVVKPTDSFSSRGITLVVCEQELADAFKNAISSSRVGIVVIEKYISGPQFFSQGFVANHKLNMFAYSDRYYYSLKNVFIPYTNAFPALIDEKLKSRMSEMMSRIVDYLKPSFGHVWAEWILSESDNELYIVEIAIRGAGAHVTTDIIPRAYNIDTQKYLIKAALGEDVSDFCDMELPPVKSAAFFSYLLPHGIVESVSGLDDIRRVDGVVCADIRSVEPGDVIPKIKDKRSRYGLIVVEGEDRAHLDRIHNALIDTIKIEVRTKEGMKGAIWK